MNLTELRCILKKLGIFLDVPRSDLANFAKHVSFKAFCGETDCSIHFFFKYFYIRPRETADLMCALYDELKGEVHAATALSYFK